MTKKQGRRGLRLTSRRLRQTHNFNHRQNAFVVVVFAVYIVQIILLLPLELADISATVDISKNGDTTNIHVVPKYTQYF